MKTKLLLFTKLSALLFTGVLLIFIGSVSAQTDTTWHINGIDSIKTTNHVQIDNGLTVQGHLIADSIKVKSIHIGDSSLVFGSIPGSDIMYSTIGNIGIGATANPNSGFFSWLRVGMGTAFPQHSFHINDSQTVIAPRPVNMAFTNCSGGGTGSKSVDGFQLGIQGNLNAELNQQENKDIIIYTGNNNPSGTILNAERMRIMGATGSTQGFIGIGTATPAAKLEVDGTSGTTIKIVDGNQAAGKVLTSDANGQGSWQPAGNGSEWLLAGNNGTTPGTDFIGTIDAKDWVVKTTNTERMRVLSGGNVGIGSTTALPIAASGSLPKLTVASTIGTYINAKSYANDANGTHINLAKSRGATIGTETATSSGDLLGRISYDGVNTSNAIAIAAYIDVKQDGAGGSTNIPGRISFFTGTSSANPLERMRIDNAGNVGIGITSPTAKLHVNGGGAIISDFLSNNAVLRLYDSYSNCAIQTTLGDFGIFTTTNERIRVLATSGYVGIGTTAPGAKLDVSGTSNFTGTMTVNGNINGSGTFNYTSDQLFKTNVDSLQNALTTISQLKPKSYYFDTTNVYGLNFSNKKQYGFIAQDVETILPELITETTKLADYDTSGNVVHPAVTYKGLNYNAFFGILTRGIQEQSNEIDSLKIKTNNQDSINTALQQAQQQSIDSLRAKTVAQDSTNVLLQNSLNQLMAKTNYQDSINTSLQDQLTQLLNCCNNHGNHGNNLMPSGTNNSRQNNRSMNVNDGLPKGETTLTDVELSNKNIVVLNQNVPNPFAEQTTITYFLPDNVTRAQILFFEQSGKIIKTIDLTERGKGQLNVFANDLSSGIYTYSLIVDGKVTESKKMVKQ